MTLPASLVVICAPTLEVKKNNKDGRQFGGNPEMLVGHLKTSITSHRQRNLTDQADIYN